MIKKITLHGLLKWKLPLIVVLVISSTSSFSQGWKNVQLAFGIGFAPTWSFGSSSDELKIITLEPRYVAGRNTFAIHGEVAMFHSQSLGIVFYRQLLTNKKIKPFIGLGCDAFHRGFYRDDGSGGYQPSETKTISIYPRVGVTIGNRFQIIIDYNMVPSTNASLITYPNTVLENVSFNNNYLAIKFCVLLIK